MAEFSRPPKVFISYAWEDDVKIWVLDLATRLRQDGVEAILDQWALVPGDQLTQFMEGAIRESDFVLFICTPTYKRKSDRRKGGVGYEGGIITAEVFAKNNHRKFIPVLQKGKWKSAAPSWAIAKFFIDLRGDTHSDANYHQLLDTLLGKLPTAPPVRHDTVEEKRKSLKKAVHNESEQNTDGKAALEKTRRKVAERATSKSFFKRRVIESLPNSTLSSLRTLENNFLKMKDSATSDDLSISQITNSLKVFSLILDETIGNNDDNSLIVNQLESIEQCIQFINTAINNRFQTGKYYYESSLFNPRNAGPFSKLYSFYVLLVDLFERVITRYINIKGVETHRLNFLVDISPNSFVRAQSFVPLRYNKIPVNEFIGITINGIAFFQVRETVILLLHEIGHYVRPYDRVKRNQVLLSILINWLSMMVFEEVNAFLYGEVLSSYKEIKADSEKIKINEVRKLFESKLGPAINSIISTALRDYFEEYIKSDQIVLMFGTNDQYDKTLNSFEELLDYFLNDLADHLNEILFLRKEQQSEYGIRKKIGEILRMTIQVETNEKRKDGIIFFEHLCEIATELFKTGNIFEYKKSIGNSLPGLAIDSYLSSLSLLGLNEFSSQNLTLFTEIIVQRLKKSVDKLNGTNVLQMLMQNAEEALAQLFWIRALDIRDFESYWRIEELLIKNSTVGQRDQIRFFGIPNAIITEYFRLLENSRSLEYQKYTIPAVDFQLTYFQMSDLPTASEQLIDILRYIFFIPMARYLTEQDNIFPEEDLFQLGKGSYTSEDGKLIHDFRHHFIKLVKDVDDEVKFESEIRITDFLLNANIAKKAR